MLLEFTSTKLGALVLVNLKPASTAISLEGERVYSFDLEGRLLSAWQGDFTDIRTLDNRLIRKSSGARTDSPWKTVEEIRGVAKHRVIEKVNWICRALVAEISSGVRIQVGAGEGAPPAIGQIQQRLQKLAGWDPWRLEGEWERFHSVYRPISILPPDHYLSLVLQATEGCHWNRCSFCHFYDQTHFHIKSEEEFTKHIQEVKSFMGESLWLRKNIFLGDANALVIPQAQLLRFFELLQQNFLFCPEASSNPDKVLSEPSIKGVYSFLDTFMGERKTVQDFVDLRRLHLRRVYLGVESGCDVLLQLLNKPSTSEQVEAVTVNLKSAGIQVGIIILAGVGGDYFSRTHVEETIQLINSLGLGKGDLIYLSPLLDSPDSPYSLQMAQRGIRALGTAELVAQMTEFRKRLASTGPLAPQIALYDIREFIY